MREYLRNYLGIRDNTPEYHSCEISGHHFEPRYNSEPTMIITPDDILKLQEVRVFIGKKESNITYWRGVNSAGTWDCNYPTVDLSSLQALVKDTAKKTYLFDVCKYCGKAIHP